MADTSIECLGPGVSWISCTFRPDVHSESLSLGTTKCGKGTRAEGDTWPKHERSGMLLGGGVEDMTENQTRHGPPQNDATVFFRCCRAFGPSLARRQANIHPEHI